MSAPRDRPSSDKLILDSEMQLIDAVQTPNKLGRLVLEASYRSGDFDSHLVDSAFVFRHDGRYGMKYTGWDGLGYQSGLAWSHDLVHWEKAGLILGRGAAGTVTEHNVSLDCILRDNELLSRGELRKVDGSYLGVYHAYPHPGYEAGPAVIGIGWSHNLTSWQLDSPALAADPEIPWEAGGAVQGMARRRSRHVLHLLQRQESR